MKALDTCVLARYIVQDDPVQGPLAKKRVRDGGYVPITVILELVWLLRSHYGYSRAQVADTIGNLVELPELVIAEAECLGWVTSRIRAGADPADLLHILMSRAQAGFVTFDKMASKVGADTPVPIEVLR